MIHLNNYAGTIASESNTWFSANGTLRILA